MSFRGASPPRAPHRALPWTRWGPSRSPDPSPIQGAPTNVNSWIRAWLFSHFLNIKFVDDIQMSLYNFLGTIRHNNLEMGKFEKKRKSGIPVCIFVVKSNERVFERFWHVSKTTWSMNLQTRDCPSKKHLVIPEIFTCAEYFWIILVQVHRLKRYKPTTKSIPVYNDHCSNIYIRKSIHM